MRLLPCFVLTASFVFSTIAQAEFAIIQDPDGTTNVRDKNFKTIAQLKANELFWVWVGQDEIENHYYPDIPPHPTYTLVVRKNNLGSERVEYIARNRIKFLNSLQPLSCNNEDTDKSPQTCDGDKIHVRLQRQAHQPKQHKYSYFIDPETKEHFDEIIAVDGVEAFGNGGYVPRTEFSQLDISYNGVKQNISIKPFAQWYNALLDKAFYDVKEHRLYLLGGGGENDGMFQFVIQLREDERHQFSIENAIAFQPY